MACVTLEEGQNVVSLQAFRRSQSGFSFPSRSQEPGLGTPRRAMGTPLRHAPRGWRAAFLAVAFCLAPASVFAAAPITFSAIGDVPYSDSEVPILQGHVNNHNVYSPSEFFVHLGDIKSGSETCAEFRYSRVADILHTLTVPAYIVPGDNETTDCTNPASGWQLWTQYFMGFENYFCGTPFTLHQSQRQENFAFERNGVLFLGINLVGGPNDTALMQDDANWVTQKLQAYQSTVRAAVVFAQAGPGDNRAAFFTPFAQGAASFAKPILYLHGDGHAWIQDRPFSNAQNVLRIQVERGTTPPIQVTVGMDPVNPIAVVRDPWPAGTLAYNRPPCVIAGPDRAIALGQTTNLTGSATDNWVPNNPPVLSYSWDQVSGPATAGFSSPNSAATVASFSQAGTYVLRLTVGDGALFSSDSVAVSVTNPTLPVATDDAYQVNRNQTLAVSAPGVLGNDSAPAGTTLSASLLTGPAHGTLSLAANGSFTYTPALNFSGADGFTYLATDTHGATDDASVAITVNAPPAALTATLVGTALHNPANAASYAYGSAAYSNNRLYLCFTNTAKSASTDPDVVVSAVTGGGISWVQVGTPQIYGTNRFVQVFRGMVTSGATTGPLTLTCNGTSLHMNAAVVEFNGADGSGTNGSGAVVQAGSVAAGDSPLTITLAPFGNAANRPIVWQAKKSLTAGVPESGYTVLEQGSQNSPNGSSYVAWNPNAADNTPSLSWSDTGTDGGGLALEIKAASTVVDRAPVVSAPATASGAEGSLLTVAVTASDPDGEAISSLTATGLPPGATFTPGSGNTSGTLSWTPSFTQAGSTIVTFTAANALSGSSSTAITIANTDQAPVVTAPATASAAEGSLLTVAVTASDPDGEAIASLTATGLPAGATFTPGPGNGSGTLSWTPGFTQAGSYSVTFTAANALNGFASTTITVANIDQAPLVSAPPTASGPEGSLLTVAVTASDPDGDAIASLAATGLPAGATFTPGPGNTSGTLSWTPATGQSGSYSVTFTASNALSGSSSTTITISNTNQPPVVMAPTTASGAEGSLLTVAVTASDPDGEAIASLAATGLPAGASFTPGAGNTSGTLSWTPGFTQAGSYVVTFTASNAQSGSTSTTITIANTDRAPVVSAPSTASGTEGALLTLAVTAADPDADAIASLSATGLPAGASFTPGAGNNSGTLSWTPTAGQAGGYTVTFTASNALSGSSSTSITINSVAPPSPLSAALVGTALHNGANAASYVYGSAAYSNNRLYLCFTNTAKALSTDPDVVVSSVTGGGITWVQVGSPQVYGTNRFVQVFRGMVTSGATAGPLTLTCNGTSLHLNAAVVEFTGADGSGTNGSGAVVQSGSLAAGTSPLTVPLAPFGNAANRPILWQAKKSTSAGTPESGYTVLEQGSQASPNGSSFLAWNPSVADNTPSMSWIDSSTDAGGLALEIKAAAGTTAIAASQASTIVSNAEPQASTPANAGTRMGQRPLHPRLAPLPLHSSSVLRFELAEPGRLEVEILDISGRRVRRLESTDAAPSGHHELTVDGRDDGGARLAPGMYFYRVSTRREIAVGRFVVLH